MAERNQKIDMMRFIAAFFVITIHSHDFFTADYTVPIARFAVPLFFMISGYYYFQTKNTKKMKKRIKSILMLILESCIIYFIFFETEAIIGAENVFQRVIEGYSINTFFNLIFLNKFMTAYHLWFLPALLFCYIIGYYAYKKKIIKFFYALIPVLLVIHILFGTYSLAFSELKLDLVYFRNWIFTGLPFFFLGAFINEYYSSNKFKIPDFALYTGAVIFTITTVLESRFLCDYMNLQELYLSTPFLALTLFLLAVKPPTDRTLNCRTVNFLAMLGREYSLYIYILQIIVVLVIERSLEYFSSALKSIFYFTMPVLIMLSTLVLSIAYVKLKSAVKSAFKRKLNYPS